tara:strand:+ start:15 stop:596 length:582 start_codon:yes stop_codon:yes gene_type:complete
MAIANSYPMGTVKSTDLLLGTSTPVAGSSEEPTTKNFSVGELLSLGFTPNIVTSTFTLNKQELENLGTTPIVLQALVGTASDGEYVQLICASVYNTGGAAGSGMVWDAAGATIAYLQTPTPNYNSITIPQAQLPRSVPSHPPARIPYNIFAVDGLWKPGADVIISTATDPVITGDVTGVTLTIHLTYRLFPKI